MEILNNQYFWYAVFVLIAILIGLFVSKFLKVTVTKDGFSMNANKEGNKDNVIIKKIKNKSDIDLATKLGQNIDIQDIDSSKVKVNKDTDTK